MLLYWSANVYMAHNNSRALAGNYYTYYFNSLLFVSVLLAVFMLSVLPYPAVVVSAFVLCGDEDEEL